MCVFFLAIMGLVKGEIILLISFSTFTLNWVLDFIRIWVFAKNLLLFDSPSPRLPAAVLNFDGTSGDR